MRLHRDTHDRQGYDNVAGRLFTSESVTEGHPDKIADQISDTVLDALLEDDPKSRVAVETLLTTGLVVVAGEVTTTTYADVAKLVREQDPRDRLRLRRQKGFDGSSCGVRSPSARQSPDIAQGVDDAYEERSRGLGRPAGPPGCRRPGTDVRLRLRRHP